MFEWAGHRSGEECRHDKVVTTPPWQPALSSAIAHCIKTMWHVNLIVETRSSVFPLNTKLCAWKFFNIVKCFLEFKFQLLDQWWLWQNDKWWNISSHLDIADSYRYACNFPKCSLTGIFNFGAVEQKSNQRIALLGKKATSLWHYCVQDIYKQQKKNFSCKIEQCGCIFVFCISEASGGRGVFCCYDRAKWILRRVLCIKPPAHLFLKLLLGLDVSIL